MFTAAQQTSAAKLPVFFLKFKKRARVIRVNEATPELKTLPIEIIFTLKLAKSQNMKKKGLIRVSLKNFDLYFKV